jgi:hypothetical protein
LTFSEARQDSEIAALIPFQQTIIGLTSWKFYGSWA